MKYFKLLAAAAMALSLYGCTSGTPAQNEEVKEVETEVTEKDGKDVDKALKEDAAADENGGADADYGTPENKD
ncbi:MAG: hypothetical protein HUJ55_01945 [Ileibacterium sp.]|nr:hypothetical protein [Ileibacterium sp.]